MHEKLTSLVNLLKSRSPYQEIIIQLGSLLKELLSSSESVRKSWHPLGFLMIDLGSISNLETVRLHIWSDDIRSTQKPSWLIHNHNWSFTSYILCGKITNQVYKINRNYNIPSNRIYEVIYVGKKSHLIATDKLVNYALISEQEFTKAGNYSLQFREFHSTFVEDRTFAATLVISKKIDQTPPEVVGCLYGYNSYCYDRTTCDTDYFNGVIKKLLLQIYS
jgi:hypothetical protein